MLKVNVIGQDTSAADRDDVAEGSHLEREIFNLNDLSAGSLPLLAAIHESNETHKAL